MLRYSARMPRTAVASCSWLRLRSPRHQANKKVRVIGRPMRERLHKRNFRKRDNAGGLISRRNRGLLQRGSLRKREGAEQLRLIVRRNPIAAHQLVEPKGRKKRDH